MNFFGGVGIKGEILCYYYFFQIPMKTSTKMNSAKIILIPSSISVTGARGIVKKKYQETESWWERQTVLDGHEHSEKRIR